jgi:hypothetical protein
MNIASRRCMVLAEIGNDDRMECHLTEVDQSTTITEIIEWVKSRDDHLDSALRERWTYARIYTLGSDDAPLVDGRQHVLTVYAKHNTRFVFTARQ